MLKATLFYLAVLSVAAPAFAHPETEITEPAAKATTKSIDKIQLPTQAELDTLRTNMPDFNGLMGDMMGMMSDPDMKDKMKNTAKAFGEQIEKSGALNTQAANGMPDFNALMGTMLTLMGDEDTMGGMLESMTDMAATMEKSVEKHAPNAVATTPKP